MMKHSNNFKNLNAIVVLAFFCACVLSLFHFQSCCKGNSSKAGDYEDTLFSFDLRQVEENLNSLDQTNPHLIRYTRVKYLHPPSKLPYNLKEDDPEKMKTVLAKWVIKFFGEKRNGIFIEAGANDGESNSNTLFLEKQLGWTGVLIECNPQLSPHILTKHRKSWVANVCLAPNSTPGTFNFSLPEGYDVAGTIGQPMSIDKDRPKKYFDVQAIPLYTIIAALGWREVDYFSFDIEGTELELLRNFPFDKVTFKVIIVEIQYYNDQQKEEMKSIFAKNDYIFAKAYHIDHYYVHKSVQHLIKE